MNKTLPRILSWSTAGVLALAVSACAADEGVPGVPGIGAQPTVPSVSLPSVSLPTVDPLPSVTATMDPPSTDSTAPAPTGSTEDPFATDDSTAAPTAPSSGTSFGGKTDKYKADQAVCEQAYKATFYYESPTSSSDYFEIYFTRAERLKDAAGKATIPEVKDAITWLQTFNQDLGSAFKARDTTKMSALTKKMVDRQGDYSKATRLLMTCRYGYDVGN